MPGPRSKTSTQPDPLGEPSSRRRRTRMFPLPYFSAFETRLRIIWARASRSATSSKLPVPISRLRATLASFQMWTASVDHLLGDFDEVAYTAFSRCSSPALESGEVEDIID